MNINDLEKGKRYRFRAERSIWEFTFREAFIGFKNFPKNLQKSKIPANIFEAAVLVDRPAYFQASEHSKMELKDYSVILVSEDEMDNFESLN